MKKSSFKIHPRLVLISIIIIGFFLRVFNLHWDNGFYLNPDERFLTMIAVALKLPNSFFQYFNPNLSLLNPANINEHFFVYGHFPLSIAKLISVIVKYDNYGSFYVIGRLLSAIADSSIILAVYLIAKRLVLNFPKAKNKLPILSALIYAIMAYPIQISHFFTVDPFLNAFCIWALYFSLLKNAHYFKKGLLSGIFFGLALSSKITGLYILPLLLVLIVDKKDWQTKVKAWKNLKTLFIFTLISYLTVRITDPYLFENASFFNLNLSQDFIESLKQIKSFEKTEFYPPSLQWYGKNWIFPIKNIVLYGLGPIFSILAILGIVFSLLRNTKKYDVKKYINKFLFNPVFIILVWLSFFLTFQSLQYVKTMRYYTFVYPICAIFIGYFLCLLSKKVRVLVFFLGFIWTFLFMQIYVRPNTRISASYWIFKNLPNQSKIVWEYWDDPLPLLVKDDKSYSWIQVDFYEKDSPEKWKKIAKRLKFCDYIILSSNRQWKVLQELKKIYPITSKYYALLFKNKLGFKKIKEFTSYPGLKLGYLKWEINDSNAEEAFTVYDHPQVYIFKKTPQYSEKFLKLKLGY